MLAYEDPSPASRPTVQEFMTPQPITITSSTLLADVATLLREHAVRHVPVVDDGKLVGVLSERDLHIARTLKSVTLNDVTASLVMAEKVLVVEPDALLSDVAALMMDRRVGSAIVMHDGGVVGIFTTQDALLALHRLLGVS